MKKIHVALISLLASFFLMTSVQEAIGQAPNLTTVWPLYGSNSMFVNWSMVPGASAYRVIRKVNVAGMWPDTSVLANTNTFTDNAGINMVDTFFYKIQAKIGANWGGDSNVRGNRMTKFWPVTLDSNCTSAESIEVLNGFNQPIRAGGSFYLHEGMDLHGEESVQSECVRAPLGGRILFHGLSTAPGASPATDIYVNMSVYMNGQVEYLQFNHLKNLSATLVNGSTVLPGEKLGSITSTGWTTALSNHTHFHYWTASGNFWASTTDPHKVFDSNAHRDPQNQNPRVTNTNGDNDSLRFKHGPNAATYFSGDTIYNAVDIVVECNDPQSSDAPWAAPKSIGYFIQKKENNNWVDAVKSAGTAYLLTDNNVGFYNSNSATSDPDINEAIYDSDNTLESTPPTTPAGYNWDQFWTYIVTNTKGSNGASANLDKNQCWATNARNTVAEANGYKTNFDKARVIDEAKFEDGTYRVNIRLRDYLNSPADFQREFHVDNFRPYVKKVEINAGQLNYLAQWNWSPGVNQLQFTPNSDTDKACGEVEIFVYTSEPMNNVSVAISTLNYNQNTNSAEANSNKKKWKFTIPANVIENANPSETHRLSIDGKDLVGNNVQGFPGTGAFSGDAVPKHQLNGTWLPNTAPYPDTLHKFKIDSLRMSFNVTNVTCQGNTDGKIVVNALGGTTPYQYSLNGAGFQGSKTFNNLAQGNYTVKVKDNRGCSATNDTTIRDGSNLNITVSGGGFFIFCDQDGPPQINLTASASGGTPFPNGTYHYNWGSDASITVSSSGSYTAVVTDAVGCSKEATVWVIIVPILCSRDPNDIIGPPGFGDPNWVSINDILPYMVRFENDPEFATAPAQRVEIEHYLDDSVNPFSFRLGSFGFANLIFEVPPNSTFYSARLNVIDSLGVHVDVTAGIDITQNKAFWIFESVDSTTGLPPTDALLGMLPVNDTLTNRGEGFVNFTVKPKSSSITGDSILAKAEIVFDENEIILTPEIFNLIDALPPATMVDPLPPIVLADSFFVSWIGMDDPGGSGVRDYELYFSEDGAGFQMYQGGILDTGVFFVPVPGATYDFFTLGTDNTGNKEAMKSAGESSTQVEAAESITVVAPFGLSFCQEESIQIDWTLNGVGYVDIAFSNDGGATYTTIATDIDSTENSFTWIFPEGTSCSNCQFLVSDVTSEIVGESEAFPIFPPSAAVAGSDIVICADEQAQLSASGGATYIWTPPENLDDPSSADPVANIDVTTTFYVNMTDNNGCNASDSLVVTANINPQASITGLDGNYCENGLPVTLTGNPSGGEFSGNGITGDEFDPLAAGLGAHVIEYIYTDNNGCSGIAALTTEVSPLPSVFISGLQETFCADDLSVTLSGLPEGGTFSGNGVSGNVFDPSQAGAGIHDIFYSYTGNNFCSNEDTVAVEVFASPVVYFTGLEDTLCVVNDPVDLTGTPTGGTFSGPGVTGSSFDPSLAGEGDHLIEYSFTSNEGCTGTVTQIVVINDGPDASFSGLGAEYCENDLPVALTGSPPGGLFTGPGVSGNTFDPLIAGEGTHDITYYYSDPSGCDDSQTQGVTVHPLPVVSFTGLDTAYCETELPSAITGNPAGGIFSGPGITGDQFDPMAAGQGTHTIVYTYLSPEGCENSTSQFVDVTSGTAVSFTGLLPTYCLDETSSTLTGSPVGGTFSGAGISGNTFDPAQAGEGIFSIEYTYVDQGGCENASAQTVEVFALPQLTIVGLEVDFCVDNTPINLVGNPEGGLFSGTGVTGNLFDPGLAGEGIHNITYSYTDFNSCSNSISETVEVFALPIVSFSGLDPDYCANEGSVPMTGLPSGGTFSGSGISGDIFDPVLAGQGPHEITYTYVDANGCGNTSTQTVQVYAVPDVSFSGLNPDYCLDALPATLSGFPEGGFFSGSGIVGTIFNPFEAGEGSHTVIYTFTDANSCSDSTQQITTVNPLPIVFLGNDTTLAEGETLALDAGNPGADYDWSTGEITQVIVVSDTGVYSVFVTDINGCSASDDIVITLVTSVLDPSLITSLEVFPNPTTGELMIRYNLVGVHEISFRLITIEGKLLRSVEKGKQAEGPHIYEMRIDDLAPGMYLLQIIIDEVQFEKKVIKID